jgi:hypothetical protein
MKTKESKKLPDKASELIRLAVADLKAAEKSKEYLVDMGYWHLPDVRCSDNRERCLVCFAGAVMARTMNIPPRSHVDPYAFPTEEKKKLLALDNFRSGYVKLGLQELLGWENTPITGIGFVDVTDYEANPDQFKAEMLAMARGLARVGL